MLPRFLARSSPRHLRRGRSGGGGCTRPTGGRVGELILRLLGPMSMRACRGAENGAFVPPLETFDGFRVKNLGNPRRFARVPSTPRKWNFSKGSGGVQQRPPFDGPGGWVALEWARVFSRRRRASGLSTIPRCWCWRCLWANCGGGGVNRYHVLVTRVPHTRQRGRGHMREWWKHRKEPNPTPGGVSETQRQASSSCNQ